MDSERALRARFVQALDDVLPPAPWVEDAVIGDLRGSRGRKGSRRARAIWSVPTIRFAAALVLIALIAAAVGALVLARTSLLSGSRPAPAGPISVEQYQAMTRADLQKFVDTNSFTCAGFDDSTCLPNLAIGHAATKRWLDDLRRSQPPVRYEGVDYLIRRHLALVLSTDARFIAGFHAKDRQAEKTASDIFGVHFASLQTLGSDVINPADLNLQGYKAIVLGDKWTLLQASTSIACGSGPAQACSDSVTTVRGGVEGFLGDLARDAGPATSDRLEADLVQAASALELVESALGASDRARLQAALTTLRQRLARVDADAAALAG